VSLAWLGYRALAGGLGMLAPHAQWLVSSQERASWGERLGRVEVPGGVDAWIHAASMGETLAASALLEPFRLLQPGMKVHLTATTRGGRARLRRIDPGATLAPLDMPQCTERFFRGVKPRRLFLLETELWFHWLLRAAQYRVPAAVVSARLSPRSLKRYRTFGAPLRKLVAGLEAVLCQSEADAERWRALGARPERVAVVGNLKNDALAPPAASRPQARALLGLDPVRPLLVLGSLRPGEAGPLARAWRSLPADLTDTWQVAAVPRHPAASSEVLSEAVNAGVRVVDHAPAPAGAWCWDDRLGVLASYYQAGEVAFVGGSLGRYAGHNPLEPAACGAAVVMGPHHRSQLTAVHALTPHGGLWIVKDERELVVALTRLLGDPRERERRAAEALATAEASRGAAQRAVHQLAAWNLWPVDPT
jgi:3-deoxy-D-manno-octulosonic-acid transferase